MPLRNMSIKHQKRARVIAYVCTTLIALEHVPILTINYAACRSGIDLAVLNTVCQILAMVAR